MALSCADIFSVCVYMLMLINDDVMLRSSGCIQHTAASTITSTRKNTRRNTAVIRRAVAAVAAQAQVALEMRQRRLGRENRRNTRSMAKEKNMYASVSLSFNKHNMLFGCASVNITLCCLSCMSLFCQWMSAECPKSCGKIF